MKRLLLIVAITLAVIVPGQGAERVPTFTKDIAPILYNHCASCHRPDEVGPFPLITFDDARKRAKQILRVTEKKQMPPWKPDAGAEVFREARLLSTSQLATIKAWVEGDTPKGDPNDLPNLPSFPSGWHLGKPDLILKVDKPFKIPAEGKDIYVHFVLPHEFKQEQYLRAAQVLPSNRRVAHHAVPMFDAGQTAKNLAKKAGSDHYINFGGPGFIPMGFLPGYAPGQMTKINKDDDSGITIAKGHTLVLQMHYHPTGKEEIDQPQIGLYFNKQKAKRNSVVVGLANNDVYILPGDKNFKRQDSFKLPADFEVRNIWGHMHMIGKEVKAWAELPDGTKKDLINIPDWDFNWQDTYTYKKFFTLPKGTVIHTEWTWDNSKDHPRNPFNPPQKITWGEGSTDEMSGLIIGGVTMNPNDEIGFWIAVVAHYLEVETKAQIAKAIRDALQK